MIVLILKFDAKFTWNVKYKLQNYILDYYGFFSILVDKMLSPSIGHHAIK